MSNNFPFPMQPFSDGWQRQALSLALGFGCCAPEASVGIGREPGETRILRIRRRKALAPAPSPEKSPPYDSKRSARTSRPRDLRVFTPNQNPKKGATLDWMVTPKSLKRSKMQTIYAIILGVLVSARGVPGLELGEQVMAAGSPRDEAVQEQTNATVDSAAQLA